MRVRVLQVRRAAVDEHLGARAPRLEDARDRRRTAAAAADHERRRVVRAFDPVVEPIDRQRPGAREGEVATIAPSTLVSDAVRTMAERDIHQLPVIDEGRLVGMLTRGDVLNHIQNRMQFADRPASMPSRNPVDRP